jgi:hypothetical protein
MPTRRSVRFFIVLILSFIVLFESKAQSIEPTFFIQAGSGFIPITGVDEMIEGDRFGRVGTLHFYFEGGL